MPPRLSQISGGDRTQQTPAPLLLTRRGQLPNLPLELARLAIPPGETRVLQLPILDWHVLNPNAGQLATDLLPQLGTLPRGDGAAGLTGQRDAILVLTARAASSRHTLAAAPGKSLAARVDPATAKHAITPAAAAALHVVLRTHLAAAPTDAPPLDAPPAGPSARRRRADRAVAQSRAFVSALPQGMAQSALASVQGGDDAELRAACAKAVDAGACAGISIDGLYAGEARDTRWAMVRAAVEASGGADGGLRVLSGGSGAPSEVLAAVREGVDAVEADYPFELAGCGLATALSVRGGRRRNVRDRRLETCAEPLVAGCECFVCRQYSVGYLRHLFEVHEMMGVTLVAAHNLWDYLMWFRQMREAIGRGEFERFAAEFEGGRWRAREAEGNSGDAAMSDE